MNFGNSGTPYGGGMSDLLGDLTGVKQHAKHHAGQQGNSGEDDSIFSSALNMLQARQGQLANEDVDENHMVQSHQSFFGGGNTSNATSGGMGAAAAMQALKMFNGGGSSQGGGQQEFVGMAMGQAAKLFDHQAAQGNVADGESKQSAVQQAGEMALKMYMKSEMGGSGGGLMSMASKFM